MSYIKIDLSDLEKDLRGIVHKYLNGVLEEMDIKSWIQSRVDKHVASILDKTIEKKVYGFLEESEIEVPGNYRYSRKKITLNAYIIQITHDYIVDKIHKLLNQKVEIKIKDGV